MSATNSDDAVNSMAYQDTEFRSRVAPSEPMQTGGHKPGVKATEADNAPEFSAQTLPAGAAPPERTFKPNPNDENLPTTQYDSNVDPDSVKTDASDTLTGATSSDVHTGYGHPGQGQTSAELRHDGQRGGVKQGTGLIGKASTMETGGVENSLESIDQKDPAFANQRALDKEEGRFAGERGNIGGPPAEERIPESAETVAAEAPKGR